MRMTSVLRTVEFNDQARRHTGKIGDVRANRDLSAEMRSCGFYGP